ncbi:hypothetical protein EDB83DRAFT_2523748 [Lactarius deliciosus]|nr:hypothetical protein EDB83DRAFT_2523748 [Lactarius deliciosus]
MSTATDFTSTSTLNYDLLASPDTRPAFIQQLQSALINVGFLYLEHPPIPTALFDGVVAYLPRFFGLPQERKDALRKAPLPRLFPPRRGAHRRCGGPARAFATPFENEDSPSQDVPGFKTTFERYLAAVESPSYEFVRLVAEALGFVPDGLARFFDAHERMQHHAKSLKYPTRDEAATEQGIGPHFDAGFMTFPVGPEFVWAMDRGVPTSILGLPKSGSVRFFGIYAEP